MEDTLEAAGLTAEGFAQAARERRLPQLGSAKRLYAAFFETGSFSPESVGLGPAESALWRAAFHTGLLEVVGTSEEQGEFGATVKSALRTRDGSVIETVLVPMPRSRVSESEPRDTLCISSQAGCRMACAFCETGRHGFRRNLTAGEIVSQVLAARAVLGRRPRNIVFMGMGEPLDNFEEVSRALQVLADRCGLRYAQERITVCTCGPPGGIPRLASLGWKRLNLSVSLNAGDDGTRDRLMPVNRNGGLALLAGELAAYPLRRNFVLGINHCLVPGLNGSPEDADRIAAFCARFPRVLVNVIPYNPGISPIAAAPDEQAVAAFVERLGAAGLHVRRRATKGRSIMAGCGQLGAAIPAAAPVRAACARRTGTCP